MLEDGLRTSDTRFGLDGFDFDAHLAEKEEDLRALRLSGNSAAILEIMKVSISHAETKGACKMCEQVCALSKPIDSPCECEHNNPIP